MPDYRELFPSLNDSLYLNHAAIAPWPLTTSNAVQQFALENANQGARNYAAWMQMESICRNRFAQLLNCSSDNIALLKNTSEGLSLVAAGIEWHAGENIVLPDCEFPSNFLPWDNLASKGVSLRYVDIHVDDPEQALMNACDENTRMVTVSATQYIDGLRLDLQRLGDFCEAESILFNVDAIQQLGMLPLDVKVCKIDFLSADAHKWLLGPEGLAVFYCAPKAMDKLTPVMSGWRQMDNPFDFDRDDWTPSRSARSFEPGSPNMLGIVATNASLGLLLDTGMQTVATNIRQNVEYLYAQLSNMPHIQLHGPAIPERRSGMINFTMTGKPPEQIYSDLLAGNIICAKRGPGIRLSPHYYQTEKDLQRCCDLLADSA